MKRNLITCIAVLSATAMSQLVSTLAAQDYTISTIEGTAIESTLDSISADGRLGGSKIPEGLSLNDVALVQTGAEANKEKTKYLVRLIGGSELHASQVTMENLKYTIVTSTVQLELGAESIKAIIVTDEANSSLLERLLSESDTANDRVIVRTSRGEQAVTGLLEGLTDKKIMIEAGGKSRSISTDKVEIIGIILTDLLQKLPAGTVSKIMLVDGSSIVGTIKSLKDGQLNLGMAGDATISIPWKSVSRLSIRSDRVAHLSDFEPADVEQRSFGSSAFVWQADSNVFGEALTLYDDEQKRFIEYPRGIGTHSYCRLEYNLDGFDFSKFKATVGLDKQAQHRGDCEVVIEGDGIELWSAHIVGNEAPQVVDIDVAGVSKLAIIVKPGKHLDLGDHVNWANARLLKSE